MNVEEPSDALLRPDASLRFRRAFALSVDESAHLQREGELLGERGAERDIVRIERPVLGADG